MKKVLALVAIILIGNRFATAQECKFDIALSAGFYEAPTYKQANSQGFLGADFDYHLLKRWTVSTGFTYGQFAYFEDWRSNTFSPTDQTPNAKGYESHLYLTASYSVIQTNRLAVQVGVGIGRFTQTVQYDYLELPTIHSPRGYPYNIFKAEESFNRVEIPLKIEGYYMLSARIGLGINAGTYFQFNHSLSGTYVGPQIRVRI